MGKPGIKWSDPSHVFNRGKMIENDNNYACRAKTWLTEGEGERRKKGKFFLILGLT